MEKKYMIKNLFQPVLNKPALYIKKSRVLVIADLHIGIEKELRDQGLHVISQTNKMLNDIKKICIEKKPEKIILLGDIKHNIPVMTFQERKDVKVFLKEIMVFSEIHLIPGNHDGNIFKTIPKEIMLHSSEGLIVDDIGFFHGHRWPTKDVMCCKNLIMAHTHPTVTLCDRLGYRSYMPCWVKTKTDKKKIDKRYSSCDSSNVLIAPAFNPLCGGISINDKGVAGPVGKIIDVSGSQVFLLDGTYIGLNRDLKI